MQRRDFQPKGRRCSNVKGGREVKGNEKDWEGFVKQQLNWALEMKQVVDELV